jgi:hypothetical protein
MANTTNFNWETPDDTDLVKDGAAAIRTLGSAIDTSLVDLKGGTTGQVLAKNSNSDMDFVWSADASGIPATIFDAKGDIIAATAADTAARLAVGSNNQVLTADSTASTGLKWATPASGGMTVIASGNCSSFGSGQTTIISSIPQTYNDLRIVLRGLSTTVATELYLGTGDSYTSWNYGSPNSSGTLNGYWALASGNQILASTSDSWIQLDFPDYTNTTSVKKVIAYITMQTSAGTYSNDLNIGNRAGTGAISEVNMWINSNHSFDAGTYTVYGVK